MTILLSYNEIQSIARKAASGAGLPHGVAEEVGNAAAWLSIRGVDAISLVVDALAEGEGCAAILDGLGAIDELCAGGTGTVALDGDAAVLLVGLAGAAAAERGDALGLDRDIGTIVPLACLNDVRSLSMPVVLCLVGEGAIASRVAVAPRPTATGAAAYAAALELAARTYVPASELSRTLGAGAGTTDND